MQCRDFLHNITGTFTCISSYYLRIGVRTSSAKGNKCGKTGLAHKHRTLEKEKTI